MILYRAFSKALSLGHLRIINDDKKANSSCENALQNIFYVKGMLLSLPQYQMFWSFITLLLIGLARFALV